MFSTAAKTANRQATGYALALTTAARDGGMREDTIKLLVIMVHPRTSQKYDKKVLAKDWDSEVVSCLQQELDHFKSMEKVAIRMGELRDDKTSLSLLNEAKAQYSKLLDDVPPQIQLVWDNINVQAKRKFKRSDDTYSDSNLDWMASMWIQDRINANHMDHCDGQPLKDIKDLTIKDMIPSDKEKDYIFRTLVSHYAYRLKERYPLLFKSLNSSIKPNVPHQFQSEMDKKSMEFTGPLFTKSESKIEDLITMMTEIQENIHVSTIDGKETCFEKKIIRDVVKVVIFTKKQKVNSKTYKANPNEVSFKLISHTFFNPT